MDARAATLPEIQDYLAEVYGTEVTREFIGAVTDEGLGDGRLFSIE